MGLVWWQTGRCVTKPRLSAGEFLSQGHVSALLTAQANKFVCPWTASSRHGRVMLRGLENLINGVF